MNERIKELLNRPFNDLTDADKSEINEDSRLFSLAISEVCRERGWQYVAVLQQTPNAMTAVLKIVPYMEPTAPEAHD